MRTQSLQLDAKYALSFDDFIENPRRAENLFVVTHLGQLRQMEALIAKKQLANNILVVLYTIKNLIVPQIVHDKVDQSRFDKVVFVKVPVKINQVNYLKLKIVYRTYRYLVNTIEPCNLYVSSFEGHYAMLLSMTKARGVSVRLVEEGTATYKFFNNMPSYSVPPPKYNSINYSFLKNHFMPTLGQTQLFKKSVRLKKVIKTPKDIFLIYQNQNFCKKDIFDKSLLKQTKRFISSVDNELNMQIDMVRFLGDRHLKKALSAFFDFDMVYASFPSYLETVFTSAQFEKFFIYDKFDDADLEYAAHLVRNYEIRSGDILFLSQRYAIDLRFYISELKSIFLKLMNSDNKIFIKLHPKEGGEIKVLFKHLQRQFGGRVVLIDDQNCPVEAIIKVGNIKKIVGITSSVLIYALLIDKDIKTYSIASYLIGVLSKHTSCQRGLKEITTHFEILEKFDMVDTLYLDAE